MKIAFDCDGVLADGRYAGPVNRTDEMYLALAPVEGMDKKILINLLREHECYVVSARSRPKAATILGMWLEAVLNIDPAWFQGIICGVSGPFKPNFTALMGCDLLVDDDPLAVRACGRKGLLYHNEPYNGAETDLTRAYNWQDVANYVAALEPKYQSNGKISSAQLALF
jgi:5'(3')-deoxyribonucleotidase